MTDSYYYKLKNNKVLNYNKSGTYQCKTVTKKLQEGKKDIDVYPSHSGNMYTGNYVNVDQTKKVEELENGDIKYTTIYTRAKIRKGMKNLQCQCGAAMGFLGYRVSIVKVIKEGTGKGMFTFGREEKELKEWFFKNKSAQMKYIKNVLSDDRAK